MSDACFMEMMIIMFGKGKFFGQGFSLIDCQDMTTCGSGNLLISSVDINFGL